MAWEEAAVAATDRLHGSIVAAALALPGVLPQAALAQGAPTEGTVSLRYLGYRDSQSVQTRYPQYTGREVERLKRIAVDAPSLAVTAPIGSNWAVEGSLLAEEVSGATPRYYSDISGATVSPGMKDRRTAGDLKLTRYFERQSVGVSAAGSSENDYRSSALAVDTRFWTEDHNTTLNLGLGGADDRIRKIDDGSGAVNWNSRRSFDLIAGLTRVLTRNDIAQLNLTYKGGNGYYDDPYKSFDKRPARRKEAAALLRWNHHVAALGSTLRSGYRYYRDSWGIRAHTAEAAWVQPVTSLLKLTPSLRYFSQSAARFYYDPVADINEYPAPIGNPKYSSPDQRLSAFGAVALGLKAELQLGRWTTDLKIEQYEQRSEWRLGGEGSPGIDPFHATTLQLGVATNF